MPKSILIIICILASSFIHGQSFKIDSVKFSGNKRTQSKYLGRFVLSKSMQDYDSARISENMRVLRTLPGVLDVSYSIESTQHKNHINLSHYGTVDLISNWGFQTYGRRKMDRVWRDERKPIGKRHLFLFSAHDPFKPGRSCHLQVPIYFRKKNGDRSRI